MTRRPAVTRSWRPQSTSRSRRWTSSRLRCRPTWPPAPSSPAARCRLVNPLPGSRPAPDDGRSRSCAIARIRMPLVTSDPERTAATRASYDAVAGAYAEAMSDELRHKPLYQPLLTALGEQVPQVGTGEDRVWDVASRERLATSPRRACSPRRQSGVAYL